MHNFSVSRQYNYVATFMTVIHNLLAWFKNLIAVYTFSSWYLLCILFLRPLYLPPPLSAYLAEGFLHLQNRVAQAVVDWRTQKANLSSPPVHVSVKQIPYPSYRIDSFLNWNAAILPLLLIMAFIYSAGMFTKVHMYFICTYVHSPICLQILVRVAFICTYYEYALVHMIFYMYALVTSSIPWYNMLNMGRI